MSGSNINDTTEDASGVAYTYDQAPVGAWNDAANWIVGTGTVATTPPGADDSVTISGVGYNPYDIPFDITGTGQAASIDISHSVTFNGSFGTDVLDSSAGSAATPVNVTLGDGGLLAVAGDAAILGRLAAIGSGSTIQVGGTLQVGTADQPPGTANATLATELGGSIQAGSVDLEAGTIDIDSSGSLLIGSAQPAVAGAVTIAPDGVLRIEAGTIDGDVVNDGLIQLVGSSDPIGGAVSGTGTLAIEADTGFAPGGPIGADQTIRFDGPNASLTINGGGTFAPVLDGFGGSDELVIAAESGTALDYVSTGDDTGTLTLHATDGSDTTMRLVGDYEQSSFRFSDDASPITETIIEVACFCPGTLIAVPGGDTRVECLSIGDLVRTQDGASRPVLWIGRRSYDRRLATGNDAITPVRIRAGALAEGLPRRDLLVSPRHAMLVDGVLVAAGLLVNGSSVLQEPPQDDVHYFHVELADHALLLAEGAAAESFVDDGSRSMFHNADEYARLYADRVPAPPVWCAPRVTAGERLEAIRRHVAARAGLPAQDRLPPLELHLDEAEAGRLRGWARSPTHGPVPVCLDVLVDGRVVAQVLADRFRRDLAMAGIGAGCHGFELRVPELVAGSAVTVRRSLERGREQPSAGPRRAA